MEGKLPALLALYEAERMRLNTTPVKRPGERGRPVFGEGPLAPRLMLIGEAPGAEETRLGRPFMGKAGKNLDALLALAGIARESVFVTNAVKFRPVNVKARGISNRTPTPAELRESLPSLEKEILLVRPALAATLGNTPLRALCLLAGAEPLLIGDVHGRMQTLLIGGTPLCVFPLYHPASVIYNPTLLPVMKADAKRLGSILNETKEA